METDEQGEEVVTLSSADVSANRLGLRPKGGRLNQQLHHGSYLLRHIGSGIQLNYDEE